MIFVSIVSLLQVKYSLIMFGGQGSFELHALKPSGERQVLRTLSAAVGDSWTLFVNALPKDDVFWLEFRATPGVNGQGVVGIDDITLEPCKRKTPLFSSFCVRFCTVSC